MKGIFWGMIACFIFGPQHSIAQKTCRDLMNESNLQSETSLGFGTRVLSAFAAVKTKDPDGQFKVLTLARVLEGKWVSPIAKSQLKSIGLKKSMEIHRANATMIAPIIFEPIRLGALMEISKRVASGTLSPFHKAILLRSILAFINGELRRDIPGLFERANLDLISKLLNGLDPDHQATINSLLAGAIETTGELKNFIWFAQQLVKYRVQIEASQALKGQLFTFLQKFGDELRKRYSLETPPREFEEFNTLVGTLAAIFPEFKDISTFHMMAEPFGRDGTDFVYKLNADEGRWVAGNGKLVASWKFNGMHMDGVYTAFFLSKRLSYGGSYRVQTRNGTRSNFGNRDGVWQMHLDGKLVAELFYDQTLTGEKISNVSLKAPKSNELQSALADAFQEPMSNYERLPLFLVLLETIVDSKSALKLLLEMSVDFKHLGWDTFKDRRNLIEMSVQTYANADPDTAVNFYFKNGTGYAERAIVSLDSLALSPLLAIARGSNQALAIKALKLIAEIEPSNQAAFSLLRNLMNSRSSQISEDAVRILGSISSSHPKEEVLQLLQNIFLSNSASLKLRTLSLWASLGSGLEAMPFLLQGMDDLNVAIQRAAFGAIHLMAISFGVQSSEFQQINQNPDFRNKMLMLSQTSRDAELRERTSMWLAGQIILNPLK